MYKVLASHRVPAYLFPSSTTATLSLLPALIRSLLITLVVYSIFLTLPTTTSLPKPNHQPLQWPSSKFSLLLPPSPPLSLSPQAEAATATATATATVLAMPLLSAVTTSSFLAATRATAPVPSLTVSWAETAAPSTSASSVLVFPSALPAATRLPAALATRTVSSTSPVPTSTSNCSFWLRWIKVPYATDGRRGYAAILILVLFGSVI